MGSLTSNWLFHRTISWWRGALPSCNIEFCNMNLKACLLQQDYISVFLLTTFFWTITSFLCLIYSQFCNPYVSISVQPSWWGRRVKLLESCFLYLVGNTAFMHHWINWKFCNKSRRSLTIVQEIMFCPQVELNDGLQSWFGVKLTLILKEIRLDRTFSYQTHKL